MRKNERRIVTTTARKNSLFTGGNLKENQVCGGGAPVDGLLFEEEEKEGEHREGQK